MRLFFAAILPLLLILAGCSSSSGLSGLTPCEGTVTYKGEPVVGAVITFHPSGDTRASGAVAGGDGRFKVTTLQPEDGITPGNFRVTIVKYEEYGPQLPQVMSDDGIMVDQSRPQRNILPGKYANPDTSGLTANIEGTKLVTLQFDLAD